MQRWLSTTCTAVFIAAFVLAPRRARHPYLIYTAILCALGASPRIVDKIATRISPLQKQATGIPDRLARSNSEMAESAVMVGQSSSSEDEEDVNGEVVRKAVERNQLAESVKTGLWGFGFLLSIIGIWGEGA